ncbi:GspH/FimT family pseudopilin [Stutzerimonas azotifigens]|uniref:GspH/FimT family pseudopilin n=1 Tax=Stutzerimonas azotifigens TaxID=291995 RepID=UPI0004214B52|nr:GspH/FimT family pseudopilin [Stutzerimonas azotifigens]
MKREGAFTLVELAVTLTLLALVAMIAVPATADFLERNRQQAQRHHLEGLLHEARARAVIEGRKTELCPSEDGISCTNDWTRPWLLRRVDDGEVYFRTEAVTSRSPLRWSGFTQSLRFYGNGTSPVSSGRFFQCHRNEIAWQLIVSRQGRIRPATASENNQDVARCN